MNGHSDMGSPRTQPEPPNWQWDQLLTTTDILCFVVALQSVDVDHLLKQDMNAMAQRRGLGCGPIPVEQLCFFEFYPSQYAKDAFKAYVEHANGR